MRARSLNRYEIDPTEVANGRDPRLERAQRSFRATLVRALHGHRRLVPGEVRGSVRTEVDVRVDHSGDQCAPAGVDRSGQRIEADFLCVIAGEQRRRSGRAG